MNRFNVRDLFVHDNFSASPGTKLLGGFVRASKDIPMYEKNHRDEVVYILSEEGDSICAVQRPRRIIAPLVWLGEPTDKSVSDRMLAVIEAAAMGEDPGNLSPYGPGNPEDEVDADGLEAHFRAIFPTGELHIFTAGQSAGLYDELKLKPTPGSIVTCVNGKAGVIVTEPKTGKIGMAAFRSRTVGCKVKTP